MADKPFKYLKIKGGTDKYHPVDKEAREMIGDLSELTTEHKDNLVDAINDAAQSGGSGVYWCTYGVTTASEVASAISDGMLVGLKMTRTNKTYMYVCQGLRDNDYVFTAIDFSPSSPFVYAYSLSTVNSEWVQEYNIPIVQLATSAPVMDGTGSVGVSTKAAKADHMHPTDTSRASATDVGSLSNLVTTDKTSIVGAINEVAGGTLDPEDIQEAVDNYLDEHPEISGTFTNAAKSALLALLEKVAYIDQNGQAYLDTLRNLFSTTLTSISAVFTQGQNVVYDTDSLDSLKSMLVVTATYSDGTTTILSDSEYTLSGTLSAGTSIITVSFGDETDTFNVTVTSSKLYDWDFTTSLTDSVAGLTATLFHCERTAIGIEFTSTYNDTESNCYVELGEVFGFGRTIEIDLINVSNTKNASSTLVQFWDGENVQSPINAFGYHYSSNSANNKFGFITNDIPHWGYGSSTSKSYFNGNSTLKIYVDDYGKLYAYKNDTDLACKYNNTVMDMTNEAVWTHVVLGAKLAYYCLYNATITGVRIYRGER